MELEDLRFLRLPEVLRLTTFKKTRWYEGVKKGEFPPPVKLSDRCVVWRMEDIRNLLMELGNRKAV